jgi:hypothetical protein
LIRISFSALDNCAEPLSAIAIAIAFGQIFRIFSLTLRARRCRGTVIVDIRRRVRASSYPVSEISSVSNVSRVLAGSKVTDLLNHTDIERRRSRVTLLICTIAVVRSSTWHYYLSWHYYRHYSDIGHPSIHPSIPHPIRGKKRKIIPLGINYSTHHSAMAPKILLSFGNVLPVFYPCDILDALDTVRARWKNRARYAMIRYFSFKILSHLVSRQWSAAAIPLAMFRLGIVFIEKRRWRDNDSNEWCNCVKWHMIRRRILSPEPIRKMCTTRSDTGNKALINVRIWNFRWSVTRWA